MGFPGNWKVVRASHHGSAVTEGSSVGMQIPIGERQNVAAYLEARRERLTGWQRRFMAAANVSDLLEVIKDFGIRDDQVLLVVPDVSARTLRRWRSATDGPDTAMASARWEALDNLRSIVCFLLADASYDEEGIVAWLRSRQPELGLRHPLDVLGDGAFEEVLRAAESALASSPPTEGDPLQPGPAGLQHPAASAGGKP